MGDEAVASHQSEAFLDLVGHVLSHQLPTNAEHLNDLRLFAVEVCKAKLLGEAQVVAANWLAATSVCDASSESFNIQVAHDSLQQLLSTSGHDKLITGRSKGTILHGAILGAKAVQLEDVTHVDALRALQAVIEPPPNVEEAGSWVEVESTRARLERISTTAFMERHSKLFDAIAGLTRNSYEHLKMKSDAGYTDAVCKVVTRIRSLCAVDPFSLAASAAATAANVGGAKLGDIMPLLRSAQSAVRSAEEVGAASLLPASPPELREWSANMDLRNRFLLGLQKCMGLLFDGEPLPDDTAIADFVRAFVVISVTAHSTMASIIAYGITWQPLCSKGSTSFFRHVGNRSRYLSDSPRHWREGGLKL